MVRIGYSYNVKVNMIPISVDVLETAVTVVPLILLVAIHLYTPLFSTNECTNLKLVEDSPTKLSYVPIAFCFCQLRDKGP